RGDGYKRQVLTITENGYGKRSPVEDYRVTKRGAYGIKNYGLTDKTGAVVGVKVVDGSEDLLLVTQSGTLIRMDVDEIRSCGRASQGVIVMRFKDEGDRVIALSLAEKEQEISEKGSEEVLAPDAPSSEGQKEETAGED
ncbi:MAG: DNA gyrase subunit A, partial [Oscillospiraceae bacterium]